MVERSGIEKGRMRFISDWEKEVANEFGVLIVNTSKKGQYKDDKFSQPAILVFNDKFELIFEWKKIQGGDPLGRPNPSVLCPVLITHAKGTPEGETLAVIPDEKLKPLSYQGLSSVPRVICGCVLL
uniref:Uncharacterized protein n=1 Tax=Lotharella oceanica TaxID=641309 RepID=A0A7S2TEQ2_9EUKA|mmetsp:Transcript_10571/g.20278  ORF Transcript_10571/g.20278 Transcript_10571/m.20278 type:complete len:126 (+) Transcript_10571:281-658(+)